MTIELKKPPHLHVYERIKTVNKDKNKQIYKCVHPDCTHYTQAQFIVGRRILCHKCKAPMIFETRPIVKKLVCVSCSKSPKAKVHSELKETLEDMFFELEKQNL